MAVSQATIMEDVWETIESELDDITTGSISWSGSFNSNKATSKSYYPVGIIDNASILSLSDLNLDFTTAEVVVSVPVTIYDTNPKQCNQIVSDVLDRINDQKSNLESAGLYFDAPLVATTDTGMFMREAIKVHWIMVDLRFRYIYQRS
jgi:hypothetical protein